MIKVSKGLNLRSRDNMSVLEPSDPDPMYTRQFRVLPFCSAPVKSQFNIFVFSLDILNSYFHSPDLCRGTANSGCLRKPPPAACSGSAREGTIVSERERNTSLVVWGRTGFLDQRLFCRTRSRTQCLRSRARFLLRCPVAGTSLFVPRDLC